MKHSPETRGPPSPRGDLETLRGPAVRLRLSASAGGSLHLDGVMRPVIGLREGGLRGHALQYALHLVEAHRKAMSPASLNAVEAERLDMAAMDKAFSALKPAAAVDGKPPLIFLPLTWSTVRSEKSRRRLLRRVAAGQLAKGCVAVCEVVGLETGVPRALLREAAGNLLPIFRGVLARVGNEPGLVRHLEGCGFSGAAADAGPSEAQLDEAAVLRRVLSLQTIGPGVMLHGVHSVGGLAVARAAGASWASLEITPGNKDSPGLLAETKKAARDSGPPVLIEDL